MKKEEFADSDLNEKESEEVKAEEAENEEKSEEEIKEEADQEEKNETEPDEAETDETEKEGKKKPFFAKKEKKDKRAEKIAELNDKVMRQMAEFDNYRKRTEKEKAMMFDMGVKSFAEKILPVIDNFERGLQSLSEEEKQQPFAVGMDKVYKQLMLELTNLGVVEIEALNKEFNPDLHNAVMHVEDENFGENTVCEVFQKGYMYKDSVVRCAMVKVAN